MADKKKQLEELREEHEDNKETYVKVMKDITELECEIKRLTRETEDFTEYICILKDEIEKACKLYKELQSEHCQIKNDMLEQEEQRQKEFDYFFI